MRMGGEESLTVAVRAKRSEIAPSAAGVAGGGEARLFDEENLTAEWFQ
jgi:hypothetical protein